QEHQLRRPDMRTLIAISFLVASLGATAAPVAYTLDPAHTQVRFSWNHLEYSNPEAGFDDVTGTLLWDSDDVANSSARVTMAIGKRLKSAELLDVSRFPRATSASARVAGVGEAGHLRIDGDLTIHGVTRPVTLDAHLNRTGIYPMLGVPAAGFSASTVIKRS